MDQVIAETVLGGSMVGKEQIKVFKVYQFLADHMCCSKLHSIKVHMCWLATFYNISLYGR